MGGVAFISNPFIAHHNNIKEAGFQIFIPFWTEICPSKVGQKEIRGGQRELYMLYYKKNESLSVKEVEFEGRPND